MLQMVEGVQRPQHRTPDGGQQQQPLVRRHPMKLQQSTSVNSSVGSGGCMGGGVGGGYDSEDDDDDEDRDCAAGSESSSCAATACAPKTSFQGWQIKIWKLKLKLPVLPVVLR